MAGTFDHHLHVVTLRDSVQLTQRLELGELGGVVRIGNRARTQSIAQRERDVVQFEQLADLLEVRVEKIFLVMGEAPFGENRAPARNDARDALGGERNMRKPDAGVDGEIIHALLALLDQRVAIDFPGELLGDTADLFQGLVYWNRADRHRRIPDDPFTNGVNVPAGRQIHHRVRAPANRPDELFDLFGGARCDDGIADIRIDLGKKIPADDHRFGFGMIDVRRYDCPAARHLVANEFVGDVLRDRCPECVAVAQR